MNISERRRYPRYETQAGVTVSVKNEKIYAIMIDIGDGGIGVISESKIEPGTEGSISLKYTDDYTIEGIVKWSSQLQDGQKNYYRIGIEAYHILVLTDMIAAGFPERSEHVKKLISWSKKTVTKN